MKLLLNELKTNKALQALIDGKGELASLSLNEEALLFSTYFQLERKPLVIIKNNLYEAQQLYQRILTFMNPEDTILFVTEESLRIEAIASSPELVAQKIEALSKLLTGQPYLCVTHAVAVTRHLPNPEVYRENEIHCKLNQLVTMDQFKEKLISSGYEMVLRVDQPLTFSIRGGIIDVYSMNYDHPIRIEFFDTEIDSIRFFDISTQRTIQQLDEVTIIPASDILFSKNEMDLIETKALERLRKEENHNNFLELEELVTRDLEYLKNHIRSNSLYKYYALLEKGYCLLDYQKNFHIYLSSPEAIRESLTLNANETVEYMQESYQDGKSLLLLQVNHHFETILAPYGKKVRDIHRFAPLNGSVQTGIRPVHLPRQSIQHTITLLKREAKENRVLLSLNEAEVKQMITALIEQNVPYQMINEESELNLGISILHYPLEEGFHYQNLIVYTSKELFNTVTKNTRFTNKFKEAEVLSNYTDLEKGDYVVHNLYGVGKYLGILTKEINQIHRDFLQIVYRGDDVLLVPLEQFSLVRKFVSSEGAQPKLNKLGTNEWKKTKERIKENVNDIAERLLELYSAREQAIGHAFQADTELQREFEEEFEYELTKDQARAINEIKQDMMSSKPMDRLLCGDVGFGKTEVAMRAAFKAAAEGKQVAFLCPTTILSRQHYETFLKRFVNYPIQIAVLNRFVVDSQQKQIIQKVREGKVDILIGTHRLLAKDVKFKDLGLLIIDEEQRFGVEHKEKIKEFKQSIDVLSLSATPIPRTLQMSLIGIRQLSQLDTPPNHRMPVQTYVIEKNKAVIRDVVQRELARNGQVFYLFNNVSLIHSIAAQIQQDVPNASIGIVHGKMKREEIDDVMVRFTLNEYNVLICTTIIETGIDIPNANTIIIDQADHFGLSQLYQIKGRVGRSDRLAYAYLMYNPSKQLSEIAQKRLQAIKEFTELGSGYKIAMRDLTIRGAGDLLGDNQSGFIDTVGIDMYIELLQQAINEKRGIVVEEEKEDPKLTIQVDAYIPENFTKYDVDKISIYQKIDGIKSLNKLQSFYEEVTDQYGKVPKSVELLFEKKRLELAVKEPHIETFKEKKDFVELTFTSEWSSQINGIELFEQVGKLNQEIRLQYLKGSIIARIPKKNDWMKQTIQLLNITSSISKGKE